MSQDDKTINNVIIIGGGCAGLTAALYCARAELNPIVFVGDYSNKGGLLVKTSVVENYPGFPDGVDGFQLIQNMEKQAVNCGATIENIQITSLQKIVNQGNKLFKVMTSDNKEYIGRSIIIATGSNPNKLHLPNEDLYWGHGISSCAVCDGVLYRKKKIFVVGGGDTAMEEALFLTKFSNVTLIHRRDTFRASAVMQKRVVENEKITILYNTVVSEVSGDGKELTHITLKNIKSTPYTEKKIDLEGGGLFYGLGLTPNIELFSTQKELHSTLQVKTLKQYRKCHECVNEEECINKCCMSLCKYVGQDDSQKKLKEEMCKLCYKYALRNWEKNTFGYIRVGDKITYYDDYDYDYKKNNPCSYIVGNITGKTSHFLGQKNSVSWRDKHLFQFELYHIIGKPENTYVIDVEHIEQKTQTVIGSDLLELDDGDINTYKIMKEYQNNEAVCVDVEGGHIKILKSSQYSTATTENGIFVAGDVADKVYRQAIVACGEGCKAAMDVIHYLSSM